MDQETQKILEMIENGKITAEQGAKLLQALGRDPASATGPQANTGPNGKTKSPRFIGIHVLDADDEVNVKIPFGLVSCLERFIPKGVVAKVKAGDENFDLSDFIEQVRCCNGGEVLKVDGSDGTKVRIVCE